MCCAIIKHDGTWRAENIWHWWTGAGCTSKPSPLLLHRRGFPLISSWSRLLCLFRSITPMRDYLSRHYRHTVLYCQPRCGVTCALTAFWARGKRGLRVHLLTLLLLHTAQQVPFLLRPIFSCCSQQSCCLSLFITFLTSRQTGGLPDTENRVIV